jgi:hypothetical protein
MVELHGYAHTPLLAGLWGESQALKIRMEGVAAVIRSLPPHGRIDTQSGHGLAGAPDEIGEVRDVTDNFQPLVDHGLVPDVPNRTDELDQAESRLIRRRDSRGSKGYRNGITERIQHAAAHSQERASGRGFSRRRATELPDRLRRDRRKGKVSPGECGSG